MVKFKLIIGIVVLSLFLLNSCASSLDKNNVNEAIEFGKQHKFDFLSVSYIIKSPNCEEKSQPYCAYDYEDLIMYTPFMSVAFAAANKAKNYEELSQADIKDLKRDSLVVTVSAKGRSDYEAEDASAVIKYDNEVIKAIKAPTYASVDDCTEVYCTYSAIQYYTFDDFSKFKDKKIKFVIIRQYGEKEYEIDMTKYK